MPGSLSFSIGSLYGFLLVLARVGGVLSPGALPLTRNAPMAARVLLALAISLTLQRWWPSIEVRWEDPVILVGRLVAQLLAEAAYGLSVGLIVAMVTESLLVAAQVIGLQAGYGYASTIDPNSEADSGVLLVAAQILAWLLFVAFGLEQQVIRALARSLEAHPAGSYWIAVEARNGVLSLGQTMLLAGVKLALPVVAVLLMVDIAFAVLGKLHAQLQLLSLAFPMKMLAALVMLAAGLRLFPHVYEATAAKATQHLLQIAGS